MKLLNLMAVSIASIGPVLLYNEQSISIWGMFSVVFKDLSSMALTDGEKSVRRGHRRTGSRGNIELPILKPLPKTLECDMR